MENYFVGIDVSKEIFDVVVVNYKGDIVEKGLQYLNDEGGLNKFKRKLNKYQKENIWLCLEHTGCYAYLICLRLHEWGYNFSVENPLQIKHSMGIVRGKDDQTDAFRIARYAQMNQYQLTAYEMPAKALRKLRMYLSSRSNMIKQRTQIKNVIKYLNVGSMSVDNEALINIEERRLSAINNDIREIELMIRELINEEDKVRICFDKITKIKGVGMIAALVVILETECFQKSQKARAFACHCGLAPFKYESGSSVRGKTRTSKYRKKEVKSVLFNAACSAIQYDPQLRNYYKRKVMEGKNKMSALNAVANKLVGRIFAVALREEPWVELAA